MVKNRNLFVDLFPRFFLYFLFEPYELFAEEIQMMVLSGAGGHKRRAACEDTSLLYGGQAESLGGSLLFPLIKSSKWLNLQLAPLRGPIISVKFDSQTAAPPHPHITRPELKASITSSNLFTQVTP
ncbi:hypothetical protein EVAR_23848_1 [Eumeta japonica]|uniref:Uncharacterized protein n=1 Tax=Eumeta variegata TaxID=151549 RepID=A0A4C1V504_EUMVA|nr:hypothetical protein EVAR_23848_1 [Eumeta japonica]